MWVQYSYSDMRPWAPGNGYQVNVDEDITLNYPAELDVGGALFYSDNKPESPWSPASRTGSNMSLLITSINGLPEGENFIAAFNPSGIPVGQGEVNDEGACGLAVWGDDPTTEATDGLISGEAFELRLWNVDLKIEYKLIISDINLSEGLVYETDAFAVVTANVVDNAPEMPGDYYLTNAYPNPFNAITRIEYGLPEMSKVSIRIYNLSGRQVAVLVDEEVNAGEHSVKWNASDMASGIYICRMQAGQYSRLIKLTLIK